MKILVVSDKLYPDEYGGSCAVAYELIKRWQTIHDVDVFTCYPNKVKNNNLFTGNMYRDFSKKNIFYSSYKLKKIIANSRYDVIVTHSVLSWLVLYLADCKAAGKAYNIFHGPWHKEAFLKYDGGEQYIKKHVVPNIMFIIEKFYANKGKRFIFLSKYMMNELSYIDSNIVEKDVNIIPGGVDLNFYSRKYKKEEAKKILGFSGKMIIFSLRRLDKRMGLDRLINAMKKLPENIAEKSVLIIGGKGGYKSSLEYLAQDIKEHVIFAGFIPDEMKNLYFSAADLFVVPTLDLEGFGLVNLEALACGIPVLGTPQGGMVELEKKFNHMYITRENSVFSLSDSIRIMIENKTISPIVEDRIVEFSWDNIAQKYIELFKKGLHDGE